MKNTRLIFLLFPLLFCSCTKKKIPTAVVWTDNSEIVSYIELFNTTHDKVKATAVYKNEAANALPPAKDEKSPDVVIGSWLKNSMTRKYFCPVDYIFQEKSISRNSFYKQVIDYGMINEKQYLIPLSFNLPLMIFSKKNEDLIQDEHLLSIEQIKNLSAGFNKKNKSGSFSAIGYAPSWDAEFLYMLTRLNGANYREKGSSFSWDDTAMLNTITQTKEWTIARNSDTTSELNFQFRYLYMPKYKQIASERCLFAYISSNELFTLTQAQSSELDFRWIEQNGKIPVQDNLICMGLYKKAKNLKAAEEFISWLIKENTQKKLIERTQNMKLNTSYFGIAGGFSSLKNINEKVYPTYYRQLLGNLPPENYLSMPNILPYRWDSLKEQVIFPFLIENTKTDSEKNPVTLEEKITEWNKQFY